MQRHGIWRGREAEILVATDKASGIIRQRLDWLALGLWQRSRGLLRARTVQRASRREYEATDKRRVGRCE